MAAEPKSWSEANAVAAALRWAICPARAFYHIEGKGGCGEILFAIQLNSSFSTQKRISHGRGRLWFMRACVEDKQTLDSSVHRKYEACTSTKVKKKRATDGRGDKKWARHFRLVIRSRSVFSAPAATVSFGGGEEEKRSWPVPFVLWWEVPPPVVHLPSPRVVAAVAQRTSHLFLFCFFDFFFDLAAVTL